MPFSITNTVALISGGGSGIGLRYAKELLKNNAKGVALADINGDLEKAALTEIENEFGLNKAIFVQTDVTNIEHYENAFRKTIEYFGHLDILINNAGILNDAIWEKEIKININGTVNGILLGLEKYIPKYKTGAEGVIVNISSIVGLGPARPFPVYSATKHAVIGLGKSFGHHTHYEKTKVKVLTLCPGVTGTPLMTELDNKNFGPRYKQMAKEDEKLFSFQKPDSVARGLVKIIETADTASVWVAEDDKLYEYIHPPRESFVHHYLKL